MMIVEGGYITADVAKKISNRVNPKRKLDEGKQLKEISDEIRAAAERGERFIEVMCDGPIACEGSISGKVYVFERLGFQVKEINKNRVIGVKISWEK